MQELFDIAADFLKLEKVEYGGVKGKSFSTQTEEMFAEFNELYKIFSDSTYDPLDLEDDVRYLPFDSNLLKRHFCLNHLHCLVICIFVGYRNKI